MVLARAVLALGVLLLCTAAAPPPPPPQLEAYITDGRFDPGDYGWMKGRFADATAEEQEAYRVIQNWLRVCSETATAELKAQLRDMGYADPQVDGRGVPFLCQQVMYQPNLVDHTSFAAFQRELAAADPVADTYLAAIRIAEQVTRPGSQDLARELEFRTLGEQMGRASFTWVLGRDPDSPSLSPDGRAIFQARVTGATGAFDHTNTEWLKGVVAKRGWPKISDVGERASSAAWLLVQHADNDPVFQLQALRMMEPLVAQGEVSRRNYAYLYDRVMLKLAGKQRYATQVMCQEGVRQPLPLEDEANVDRLRSEMELEPVAEYIERFNKNVPCEGLPENSLRR